MIGRLWFRQITYHRRRTPKAERRNVEHWRLVILLIIPIVLWWTEPATGKFISKTFMRREILNPCD